MIDVIDGILQITLWPENKVNMFATVYQDYILRYGLSVSTGIADKDSPVENHFFIECASSFTEGMQIGMIRLPPRPSSLSFDKPEQKEMIAFLQKAVGYYKQNTTGKFLGVGQLMRPLSFVRPDPMPMLAFQKGSMFPALMNGVFRTEGELGIFLANCSTDNLEFEAKFDPARHGFVADAVYDVQSIEWGGTTRSVHRDVSGSIDLSGTLPGHGLIMFHVKSAEE